MSISVQASSSTKRAFAFGTGHCYRTYTATEFPWESLRGFPQRLGCAVPPPSCAGPYNAVSLWRGASRCHHKVVAWLRCRLWSVLLGRYTRGSRSTSDLLCAFAEISDLWSTERGLWSYMWFRGPAQTGWSRTRYMILLQFLWPYI